MKLKRKKELDVGFKYPMKEMWVLSRYHGENICTVIYEDGEFLNNDLPPDIMDKFIKYGIDNPYTWRHD